MIRHSLLALILLAGCAAAPTTPRAATHAPVVGERALDHDERAAFDEIVTWAESVRDLRAENPIDVVAMDMASLRSLVRYADSEADHSGRVTTLVELGLAPEGVDAAEALGESLAESSTAALYTFDPARVVLPADSLGSLDGISNAARGDQLLVLHEVVHALQHQRLMAGLSGDADAPIDFDRELALRGLVEGDAMLAMVVALARSTGASIDALVSDGRLLARIAEAALASTDLLPDASGRSALARTRFYAPYYLGTRFTAARFADGGWRSVDAVYSAASSLTSEHILHPETFGTSDLREPLDPPALLAATECIDDTTFGELVFRVYAESLGATAAGRAAEGWAGDRVRTYRRSDGRVATIWVTTWDTIRDAVEAADAAERVHAAQRAADDTRSRIVIRHQRAVLIATGLSDAEVTGARRTFESWVYSSLRPIDRWPDGAL